MAQPLHRKASTTAAILAIASLAWTAGSWLGVEGRSRRGDALKVTVVNETAQALRGIAVVGDMGFSLALGDLSAGASVTRETCFGPTQGPGLLKFGDETEFRELEIGCLLDDDGPYAIEVRVHPKQAVIHVNKPSDEPATWTVDY